MYREGGVLAVTALAFRSGQMTATDSYVFTRTRQPVDEALASFLPQFYGSGQHFIPREILLPVSVEDIDSLEDFLTELRGTKVNVRVPQRGEKAKIVNMATRNAEAALEQHLQRADDIETILKTLRDRLHLTKTPRRIECIDISNISGTSAVGSMVTFTDGEPDKDRYRRYKIKTIEGADDYGMMREVLLRRYQRAIAENDLPDLVILDGGLGQLNVARSVFDDLGISDVDAVGIAKGRGRATASAKTGGGRQVEEHIFLAGRKNPIKPGNNSPIMHLLQRIRDEAHRFAITYHRKLRTKEAITSQLASIPGVGPKRQTALLKHFDSISQIKKATTEQIAALPEIPMTLAKTIAEHLK